VLGASAHSQQAEAENWPRTRPDRGAASGNRTPDLLGFRLWEWNRLNQDLESVDRVSLLSDAELIAGWTTPAFFLTRQALRAVVGGGAARPGP
jgi:hypothetical protein